MARWYRRAQERLRFFADRNKLSRIPTAWQLKVGRMAGLPVYLTESERERRISRSHWLGQIPVRVPLQLLYSPSHLDRSNGLGLSARAIVRHLMCVYHEDAFLGYDLQLLESHPGGLDLLQAKAKEVAKVRFGFAPILRKMVGTPSYHTGLIRLAEDAKQSRYPDPLDIDSRFASLLGFAEFCNTLPAWPEEKGYYGFEKRNGSQAKN